MAFWFQRKYRNRRAPEREHTLDIKLRTSQTRAARWRLVGICCMLVFSVAFAGFVIWRGGQWALDGLIYQNDAFAIQQIDVQTDGVLTPEIIRQWAGVRPGQNLMALDLMRVKRDLELQPPIQVAGVERVVPHTLVITVTERDPIAQTIVTATRRGGAVDQAIYDFDENGVTLKPLDPRWRVAPPPANERLPILVGVPAAQVRLGRQTESTQVRAALALLSEFDHSPMTGMVEIERIDVSDPDVLLVTTSQKATVTFGLSDFDVQLRHWRLASDYLFQKWGKAIASIDLSVSNNLPVRWVAATSLPPVAPHAIKPSRPKRKHV